MGRQEVVHRPELGRVLDQEQRRPLHGDGDVCLEPPPLIEQQAPLGAARSQRIDRPGEEPVEPRQGVAPVDADLAPVGEIRHCFGVAQRLEDHPGIIRSCAATARYPGTAMSRTPVSSDVAKRLLEAWRGEIEARAVYEALADREKDERRAAVLRRMADGERGHLERIEARMRELDIAIPDAAAVHLSPWQRLQIRVAPVERVLASREAAEKDEITIGYGLPTGDDSTDALFSSIREDERSHARNISALTGQVPLTKSAGASPKKH